MAMEIVVKQIACLRPSTGVSTGWESNVDTALSAFLGSLGGALGGVAGTAAGAGVGAGVGALAGAALIPSVVAMTGPGAVLLIPIGAVVGGIAGAGVGGAVGAASGATAGALLGNALGDAINSATKGLGQLLPDQVYIKAGNNRVWPGATGTINMQAGSIQTPNMVLSLPATGSLNLSLWDHDLVSSDDNLGCYSFNNSSETGIYCFCNSVEGDMYMVDVIVRSTTPTT